MYILCPTTFEQDNGDVMESKIVHGAHCMGTNHNVDCTWCAIYSTKFQCLHNVSLRILYLVNRFFYSYWKSKDICNLKKEQGKTFLCSPRKSYLTVLYSLSSGINGRLWCSKCDVGTYEIQYMHSPPGTEWATGFDRFLLSFLTLYFKQ